MYSPTPVVRVLYQPGQDPQTSIEPTGSVWFFRNGQKVDKLICVEEDGLFWLKAIHDVDPIAETSETVKTSFKSRQAVWEFMTSPLVSFVGIPVFWFDVGEFVLTADTPYPG